MSGLGMGRTLRRRPSTTPISPRYRGVIRGRNTPRRCFLVTGCTTRIRGAIGSPRMGGIVMGAPPITLPIVGGTMGVIGGLIPPAFLTPSGLGSTLTTLDGKPLLAPAIHCEVSDDGMVEAAVRAFEPTMERPVAHSLPAREIPSVTGQFSEVDIVVWQACRRHLVP